MNNATATLWNLADSAGVGSLYMEATLLKYRDAMSIASKLNGAPDGSWTYYPKDVGLGRGIVGILDHLGREIGFL